MEVDTQGKKIILFDGICGLCNGFVQIVLKNDAKGYFSFATQQSDFGQQMLKKNNLQSVTLDTVVLVDEERHTFYLKSDAVREVFIKLDGAWPLLKIFFYVPKFLRDFIYDVVAAGRYRIFGKYDSCEIPKPEWRHRFLDGL